MQIKLKHNTLSREYLIKMDNPDHGVEPWECPMCNHSVTCYPATSRVDSVTEICSSCGNYEALRDFLWHRQLKEHEQEAPNVLLS